MTPLPGSPSEKSGLLRRSGSDSQFAAAGDPAVLRVRSANPAAARRLGVPLDEAVGRAVTDVFPVVPVEQVRRYAAVAVSGRADDLGEFRYGDARVAERWWAVQAFPLPDRSVGVAFQDITERKRVEAEVRQLNEELEVRVRERTADLAESKPPGTAPCWPTR